MHIRIYTDPMQSASARIAMEHPASELLGALRRYWGYDSFRPMQERIVRSLLGGQRRLRGDADRRRKIAVLPAAGGAVGGADRGGGFAADRADAGPGGAA